MNKRLDLLKKLVRLANNNPNDHEANSAARRACKLLEEMNFLAGTPATEPRPSTVTWNDVRRSTESFWRSTPPEPKVNEEAYRRAEKYYEDWFKQWTRRTDPMNDPFTRAKNTDPNKGPWIRYSDGTVHGFDNEGKPYTYDPNPNIKREKSRDENKRRMKCKTCGDTKDTLFRGPEELYECNECQWSAYERNREND